MTAHLVAGLLALALVGGCSPSARTPADPIAPTDRSPSVPSSGPIPSSGPVQTSAPGPVTTPPAVHGSAEAALGAVTVNGTYVGQCDHPRGDGDTPSRVCSTLVGRSGDRHLYRLGYLGTDVGCFVLLVREGDGWTVAEECLDGAQVPADLGGPFTQP